MFGTSIGPSIDIACLFTAASAAPAFSPLDLSPVLWLDASTGLLSNLGGGAGVGDPVLTWFDQSVNENDANQATTSKQPTLQSVTNGGQTFNVVRFDGVDDTMASALSTGATITLMFVTALLSTVPYSGRIDAAVSSDAYDGLNGFCSYLTNNFGSTTQTFTAAELPSGGVTPIINGTAHASLGAMPASGVALVEYVLTGLTPNTTGIRLGQFHSATSTFNGHVDVAEVVLCGSDIGTTNRSALRQYLGTKYGITVAP